MRYDNPELQERLAGDYVVGSLQGPARRRFEALMQTRPALRGRVEAWEDRLTPLAEQTPAQEPPARILRHLQQRINPQAEAAPSGFWNSLAFWRPFGAVAALLLVAVLGYAGFILPQPSSLQQVAEAPPEQVRPSYIAVLEDEAEEPVVVVTAYKGPWRLAVKPLRSLERDQSKIFQIWAVERGSGTIRPLLQLAGDEPVGQPLGEDGWKAVKSSESLIITVEDSGTAPASPSGAVLFSGPCINLWDASET